MYLALYRKYRPQIFEDVISQNHITVTLKNQVKLERVAHAYLFTGSRGTGKTTCSKILAKAINCINQKDGDPCLECDICLGIENGTILDVSEIDAASNNGVDNIRDLRDEANYLPSVCKYRVYIIDEVHMLSTGAFNALLKIMEEPPEHIMFILATTELHKIPATIISRCQRFDFNRIKTEDMTKRLNFVAKEQDINIEEDAINLVARIAEGGMRDALSLLDQCCCVGKDITLKDVENIAGIVGQQHLYEMAIAIKEKKCSNAMEIIDELYFKSKGFELFCQELITYFRNIMIVQTVKTPKEIIVLTQDDFNQLTDVSKQYKIDYVLYVLSCLQNCLDKMSKTSNKRVQFELTIISLCSDYENQNNTELLEKIEKLEKDISNSHSNLTNNINDKTMQDENQKNVLEQKEQKPLNKPIKKFNPKDLKPVENWAEILHSLAQVDKPLNGLLLCSKAMMFEDYMFIDSPNTMLNKMFKQESCSLRLNDVIEKHLNKRFKLMFKCDKIEQQTPDAIDDIVNMAEQNGVDVKIK